MSADFKDIMSKRTDEELIKIVTVDRNSYQPLAIIAVEEEIQNRKLDTVKIKQVESAFRSEIEEKKQIDDNTVSSLIRFANFILDTITLMIIVAIIAFLLGDLLSPLSIGYEISSLILNVVAFATFICYYYIMELNYQKTVAKFITKTKVVTNNGNKPNKSDILARTFCRLIPFDRISFLFTRNGFHDRLSSTRVIREDGIKG